MMNRVRGLMMLILLFVVTAYTNAQSLTAQDSSLLPPQNWFVLDPASDKVQGLSVDKAYELVKGKPSKKVTVAVIDSGVDIDHEDLQGKIWINEDEIEGNGIDDDKNGYVDDRYGWNFIGGKNGNVEQDTYELTRIYVDLKEKYNGVEEGDVKRKNKEEYAYWLEVKEEFEKTYNKAHQQYEFYSSLKNNLVRFNTLLKAYFGVDTLTMNNLRSLQTEDSVLNVARNIVGLVFQNAGEDADFEAIAEELGEAVEYFGNQVNYAYNLEFDPRNIIGDDYSNPYEKGYGNTDVKGHDPSHGTHVAGIIAANRNNELGIQGIADNVEIMVIRAVPDGDERDKDVANAILYAVDNGADIINMSFGKSYSPQKEAVDKAVKYAESKGILLIHAAGNSSKNIDKRNNFPSKNLDGGKEATNWLEIGASSWGDDENFVGSFSNYGKETVDVFAPGVEIYSTTPDNTYKAFDGTSMAAPSTAGVAALVMSYYPELTAFQVRDILRKSSRKFDNLTVIRPGDSGIEVDFSELSITGGLINAYEALKMAESMSVAKEN
ncbi:MAG: S8 family peptidase [Fulvivirga sp.]